MFGAGFVGVAFCASHRFVLVRAVGETRRVAPTLPTRHDGDFGGGKALVEICDHEVFSKCVGGAMGIRGGALFQSQAISSSVRP